MILFPTAFGVAIVTAGKYSYRIKAREACSLLAFALFAAIFSLLPQAAFAASLPNETFNINTYTIDDGDLAIQGYGILARKTLVTESISVKAGIQSLSVEDSYQTQIEEAPSYTEEQVHYSAGIDYLYFDSSFGIFTQYAIQDTSKTFDLAINLGQEFQNGLSALLMGFSHGWEDDSELGIHNKSRRLSFGFQRYFRSTWLFKANAELRSWDGDLINFHSARRFNDPNRTNLPTGRSDKRLVLTSSNNLDKGRYLQSELELFSNDWEQVGNSLSLSYLKTHSQKFSSNLHLKTLTREQSLYFTNDVISNTQTFFTDHRHQAQLNSKEIGLKGIWSFFPEKIKRLKEPKLELGMVVIKNEYFLKRKTSNTGQLLHLNFSSNY